MTLYVIQHHAMKAYVWVEVKCYAFLISGLDGGESSVVWTGSFIPEEKSLVTHWKRGWVGPRADLVVLVRRKISCLTKIPTPCAWPSLPALIGPLTNMTQPRGKPFSAKLDLQLAQFIWKKQFPSVKNDPSMPCHKVIQDSSLQTELP